MKIKEFFLLAIAILCCNYATGCSSKSNYNSYTYSKQDTVTNYQKEKYRSYLNSYREIKPTQLNEILNNKTSDKIYIFWGRETCPYCRAFIPKLTSYIKNNNISIYYINTEHTNTQKALKRIRNEFQIKQVPSLTKIYSNNHFENFDINNGKFNDFFN